MKLTDVIKYCNLDLPNSPFIVEIGAHYGEDSIALLKAFPNATLHIFEADPRCIVKLQENVKCTVHECAISDKNGLVDWYQSGGKVGHFENCYETDDWDESSSLLKPTGHLQIFPFIKFNKVIKVQSCTLDSFLFKSIDLIWMDVQGAEHLVFEGAKETLKRTRYIHTEYSETEYYEGQKTFQELCSILSDFDCVAVFEDEGWDYNALFKRK